MSQQTRVPHHLFIADRDCYYPNRPIKCEGKWNSEPEDKTTYRRKLTQRRKRLAGETNWLSDEKCSRQRFRDHPFMNCEQNYFLLILWTETQPQTLTSFIVSGTEVGFWMDAKFSVSTHSLSLQTIFDNLNWTFKSLNFPRGFVCGNIEFTFVWASFWCVVNYRSIITNEFHNF